MRALILSLALAAAACTPPANAPEAAPAPSETVAAPPADGVVTPAFVAAQLKAKGPTETVRALSTPATPDAIGPTPYDDLLAGVASGDAAWLALVPALSDGVDAATATGLVLAINEALPRNAAGVLALASDARPVEELCLPMMIEPTAEEVAAWREKAAAAVSAVTAPELAPTKAACLDLLNKS